MLYEMDIELELPHPTEDWAPVNLRITYGYVPGARTFSDEPPAAADLWVHSARVLDEAPHLSDADIERHAREYFASDLGAERAILTAEGRL
jgi:hypothetical protein